MKTWQVMTEGCSANLLGPLLKYYKHRTSNSECHNVMVIANKASCGLTMSRGKADQQSGPSEAS